MAIGTGVLVGQEVLNNPALKLVTPQEISPLVFLKTFNNLINTS